VSTSNGSGFFAFGAGSVMTVTRSAATSNVFGIAAFDAGTTIYVSDSTIAANGTGISTASGGLVLSRCTDIGPPPCTAGHFTNTLQANTANGAFSNSYTSN
jgi:hypothetical protein